MVDKVNPTSQFHPYQPATDQPASERQTSGLSSILSKVGIDPNNLGGITDKIRNADVKRSMEGVRNYAKANPHIVLGGLAALAIGAGLLRRRMS